MNDRQWVHGELAELKAELAELAEFKRKIEACCERVRLGRREALTYSVQAELPKDYATLEDAINAQVHGSMKREAKAFEAGFKAAKTVDPDELLRREVQAFEEGLCASSEAVGRAVKRADAEGYARASRECRQEIQEARRLLDLALHELVSCGGLAAADYVGELREGDFRLDFAKVQRQIEVFLRRG